MARTDDMFQIDDSEIKELIKFLKKAPKQFQFAYANTLNQLGFSLRGAMIDQIKRNLTIRNHRFVESSFRVDKTRGSKKIDQQTVEIGSINRKGFTGWSENQLGTTTKKKNEETVAARKGSYKNKMTTKFRLKPGHNMRTEAQYQGKSHRHQIGMLMRDMSGRLKGEPFIIHKGAGRLNPGVYIFQSDRFLKLRTFGQKQQPPRLDWSGMALDQTKREFNMGKVFLQEAEKQLKFLRKFR